MDIVLADILVSRSHADIYFSYSDGCYKGYIMDLGSTNGTFVNDKRISSNMKVIISDGDRIKIVFFASTFSLKLQREIPHYCTWSSAALMEYKEVSLQT